MEPSYFGLSQLQNLQALATIRMIVPLALDIRPMDQIRYGAERCLVCGRNTEHTTGHVWGARHIQRLIGRARRWWHHRKCRPWTVVKVEHEWQEDGPGYALTRITARGLPPRFTWWDRLLGRPRFVSPQIMSYTVERGR